MSASSKQCEKLWESSQEIDSLLQAFSGSLPVLMLLKSDLKIQMTRFT